MITITKDDVNVEDIEEIKVVHFKEPETDGMVLAAMDQLQEKFKQNEKEVNCIKRKCVLLRSEIVVWSGVIACLDDLLHEFDIGNDVPGEVAIVMSVLRGRADQFVNDVILKNTMLHVEEETLEFDDIEVAVSV